MTDLQPVVRAPLTCNDSPLMSVDRYPDGIITDHLRPSGEVSSRRKGGLDLADMNKLNPNKNLNGFVMVANKQVWRCRQPSGGGRHHSRPETGELERNKLSR